MFTGIHHVVVRVRDLEGAIRQWTETLGLKVTRTGENRDLGVRQAMFDLEEGGFIELVAPLSSESAVAKAIETRGEGVHLVSLNVSNINKSVDVLKSRGVNILGDNAGPFFVHPKSTNGVVLGFSEAEQG